MTVKLSQRLLRLFTLQPGQGMRTLLVAVYLFLIIATYMMVRPASKSLFLSRLGAQYIPWVTIVVALFLGLFVAGYIRLSRLFGAPRLTIATLGLCVAMVLGFWWLLDREITWAYPVFAVWVGMFGAIATTQVWTLANELFTTREAKRAFGIIGAGGIVGGIAGSALTRALAKSIGTVNLLLLAAGLLALAVFCVMALIRYRLPERARVQGAQAPRRLQDSLRLVAQSPHLRLVAWLVLVTALATKMVDWQFDAVAQTAFDDKDARTAFFGTFYALSGIVGVIVQVLLTSRLLMVLGLGGTILIFPLALSGGSIALITTLSLWSAVVARGSDATLKHSIDRSSRELVYLPVSRSIKVQAKSAIDMVVDRAGDGIAGFAQLAIIAIGTAQGLSQLGIVRQVGLVNLLFLAAWILIAVRLRRSYVDELHRSIAEGRLAVGAWQESLAGADTLGAVRASLRSENESEVHAALDLVAANPDWDLQDALTELAKSASPSVRARTLSILLDPEDPDLPQGVEAAFQSEDKTLLAECIDLLVCHDPQERRRRAQTILAREGGAARGAWIALMVRRLGPEFYPVGRTLLGELVAPSSPANAREVAATSIGLLPASFPGRDLLEPLLDDPDPRIASAAARSAVHIGDADLLARTVPLLGRPGTRRAARKAFQQAGERVVETLLQAADDADVPRRARLQIPSVLAGIQTPETLDALAGLLDHPDIGVVGQACEALYRIRLSDPELQLLPESEVQQRVLVEARRCEGLGAQRAAVVGWQQDDPAADLLRATLRQAHRDSQARLFRLLCLTFRPRDILQCRRSLVDDDLELRANAAELLDNLVPRRLWRELLPILYREEFGKADGGADDVPLADVPALLRELSRDDEPWVRTCAIYAAGAAGVESMRPVIEEACSHPDGRMSEAARAALARLDGGETMKGMTAVEKVVALRGIDIFADTPPEQLSRVAAVAREELFPADATLCREGDPPGDLFVLLDGRVAVERDGRRLGELAGGEAIGTWALFEDDPRTLTARTLQETPALRIDRWGFEEVLDEHPEIARSLIGSMVRRVRKLAEGR